MATRHHRSVYDAFQSSSPQLHTTTRPRRICGSVLILLLSFIVLSSTVSSQAFTSAQALPKQIPKSSHPTSFSLAMSTQSQPAEQQLHQHSHREILKGADNIASILSASATLVLINATPYRWNRTFSQSFHLTKWDFPVAIEAGMSPLFVKAPS